NEPPVGISKKVRHALASEANAMSQTNKVIRSSSGDNGRPTSREPLSRVFDIGSRGRHARSAAGAILTTLAHGGIALFVFWCGDLSALAVPLEAEEFTIEPAPENM